MTPSRDLATESVWATTILTPFSRDSWRSYLYFVVISLLAVVGVVFLFGAGLASGLLIVTLVGIPLLALVVVSGRGWNRLYRSLARLCGATIDAPPRFQRPSGRLQTGVAAVTDAVGWRSLGFLAVQAVLMTPIGFWIIVGLAVCVVLMASPVIWLAMGEPFVTVGEPVDSLGAYVLLAVGGAVADRTRAAGRRTGAGPRRRGRRLRGDAATRRTRPARRHPGAAHRGGDDAGTRRRAPGVGRFGARA